MDDWKEGLYEKVKSYIRRDIKHQDTFYLVYGWWSAFGTQILNEFEFTLDIEKDKAAQKELIDLKGIILRDANIDKDDPNTDRMLFHLTTLIREFEEEVDYEDGEDLGEGPGDLASGKPA